MGSRRSYSREEGVEKGELHRGERAETVLAPAIRLTNSPFRIWLRKIHNSKKDRGPLPMTPITAYRPDVHLPSSVSCHCPWGKCALLLTPWVFPVCIARGALGRHHLAAWCLYPANSSVNEFRGRNNGVPVSLCLIHSLVYSRC